MIVAGYSVKAWWIGGSLAAALLRAPLTAIAFADVAIAIVAIACLVKGRA